MADRDDELDAVWRALSDPTRRRILDLIREKPRTVGDVSEAFAGEMTRFAVMKHLGVLKQAGLVVDRREGRQVWNHLNAVPLRQVYERWVSRYESAWAEALLGLKRVAEGAGSDPRADERVGQQSVGVRVEQDVTIKVARAKVFGALSEHLGAWWPLRDAARRGSVRLEAQVGGRLMEDWGEGRGALLATVTTFDPPRAVSLLGPMVSNSAALTMLRFDLEGDGDSTLVRLSFHDSAAARSEAPGRVLRALKDFLESGKRFAA